jgi:hypothetical protein
VRPDVKPKLWASAIVLLWCGVALAGGAATDAYEDIDAAAPVDVHAFADVYGVYNSDAPASRTNQLRAFDVTSGRPSLGYLRLTLAHRPQRVGFRVDAGFGAVANTYETSDPAFTTHRSWARALSYFGQAFFTAVVPTERPISIDVGKFGTPVGLEDNESLPNWNYSRSFLYTWAEPSLHTGLRLSCELTPTVAVSAFWVNGWDANIVDGNHMRSFAGALTWHPTTAFTLSVTDMAGLERPPFAPTAPLATRNVIDAFVVLAPTERLSFATSGDYGVDGTGAGLDFWGAAGYARLQAWPWLAGALRGEYVADPAGFITATPQGLVDGTATLELRRDVGPVHLVGRLEVRHDRSSAHPFDGAVRATQSTQDTITLAMLAAY